MEIMIALLMFASCPAEKWQDYRPEGENPRHCREAVARGRANHVRIARVRLATAVVPLARRMTVTCNVV